MSTLDSIRIEFKDENLNLVDFNSNDLHCVLHLKKMGNRLLYNYKQQKWIPYVSDPDKWYQHLLDVRDGYRERDSQGHYIVGSGRKYRELKEMKSLESKMETQRPVFNFVSPEAQATEMAKSK